MRQAPPFVLIAVWWIAGCIADDGRITRTEVGDTVAVASARPLIGDTAELVLVTRFGAFDGTPENEFQAVGSFAVGADGSVFAFDADTGIKEFASDGAFRRWIARTGEGPWEVGYAPLLAVRGADLAAYDTRNARIAVFDISSESAPRTHRRPSGLHRFGEDGLFFDADGELWVGLTPDPPAQGPIELPRPIAARLDFDRGYVDTLFVPGRYHEQCPILSERLYRAGGWEDKREQWYPKVKWAMSGSGTLVFGCPRRFELDVLRPGEPLLRISKPWTPAETTADERQFYEQWWTPIPPLPEQRPAYARIVLAEDGRIWVWPEQASETLPYDDTSRQLTGRQHGWVAAVHGAFEVFTPEGEWLGAVRVPESVAIRGDTVWAVMYDEIDVEYIGRFEVRWPR